MTGQGTSLPAYNLVGNYRKMPGAIIAPAHFRGWRDGRRVEQKFSGIGGKCLNRNGRKGTGYAPARHSCWGRQKTWQSTIFCLRGCAKHVHSQNGYANNNPGEVACFLTRQEAGECGKIDGKNKGEVK